MRSLVLLFIAAATIGSACSATGPTSDEGDDEEAGATEDPLSGPTATGPVTFADACRAGTSITIAAVGDVLLHTPLQKQAYSAANGHHSLWSSVEGLVNRADISWANLEGPCADGVTTSGTARDPGKVFDGKVYSSYPEFNYHPSLIGALKDSGFDIVSTANNHAMDRRSLGADKTIDNLNAAGLPFAGTHKAGESADGNWYRIVEAKGIKVGFVACTFSTNGIPDSKKQVLHCYEDKSTLIATIKSLASQVDAVIVTPHWGTEYNHSPDTKDKNLGKEMLEAGALAVLGNHPHVTQPMEKIKTSDGRETFIIYSLGNFVSGQTGIDKRSSEIIYLGLTKGDGKTTINGVRHLPIYMQNAPYTAVTADGHSADSLALTSRILGQWNRIGPTEPLVTNPSCQQ